MKTIAVTDAGKLSAAAPAAAVFKKVLREELAIV